MRKKQRTKVPENEIEKIVHSRLSPRKTAAEKEFVRRQALMAFPSDTESLCAANDCLCGSFLRAFNCLSADEKAAFSYWLLQVSSQERPLTNRELHSMAGYLSQILKNINPEDFETLVNKILESLAEAISH